MKKQILHKLFFRSGIASLMLIMFLTSKAQNLLTISPSFEDGTGTGVGSSLNGGFWSRINTGDATAVQNYLYRESTSPTAKDGTYYAKCITPSAAGFNTPSALQAINSQNLTTSLTNGKTYRVSFWYQNSATHTFRVTVENNAGGSEAAHLDINTVATSWTFASFNFTFNSASLTSGNLKLQFGADAGTTIIDNMRIEDVATLPVNFTAIAASYNNASIVVNWGVGTEVNTAQYDVERSSDATNFKKIGSVAAIAKSNYNYADALPANGNNYYRIKAIDKDGSYSYSSTVRVNAAITASVLNVYPNPVIGKQLNLELNNFATGNYQLQIFSADGKKVFNKSIINTADNSTFNIQLPSNINKGIYQLQLGNDVNKATKTISIP